jgi:plastocyanin
MRLLSCVLCCALSSGFVAADDKWVTIKGQVVFPKNKPIPKREALNVNQAACLAKGPILDESVIVNPTNRGVKNVVVYLRPDDTDPKAKFAANQIHPDDAKRKPAQVVIDQPCCMFVDRVTCARVGDTLVVKNSAAIVHNFFWSSTNNGECNANIPAGGKHLFDKPLVAEGPIQYKCTIHGWMTGYVRIFDHPYYAVTDEDGNFEIKNAPAGKFRIVYWHENGLRGGKEGRFGEPITITGPTLEMKPTDFEVGAK